MDQIYPKTVFPALNGHRIWILHIWISRYQVSPLTGNFDFLDQICAERVFPVEKEKSEQHHWTLHVRIRLAFKFHLILTLLIFWGKFAQNGIFGRKQEKWANHWILHIRIRLGAMFLGAMAFLGQSRESWPSMAPLGHVQNSQTKMLWHF